MTNSSGGRGAPKPDDTAEVADTVDAAVRTRQSARAYLRKPVPKALIEQILELSRFAPSGTNTQPWRAYVLTGAHKTEFCDEVLAAYHANDSSQTREYEYYPTQWFEPYLGRRRACGWGLYGALNITREDKAGMHAQHARNFTFFDAPVGLIFTLDRRLNTGSWLDLGMFLQNVMLCARARGLHTCPQAAFANYHRIIREHVPLTEDEVVVCGMALGYRDADAVENQWRTEREPVSAFTQWFGF